MQSFNAKNKPFKYKWPEKIQKNEGQLVKSTTPERLLAKIHPSNF